MKLRDTNNQGSRFDRAVAVFKKHGGILRTAQALRAGIHPGTLYAMRDSGVLEVVSRGVYRLADSAPLGNPDLVTVATRVPGGVICLISALAFHELTTQIPHEVHVALPRGAERATSRTTRRSRLTGSPARRSQRAWRPMNSTVSRAHLQPGEDARRLLQVPQQDRARYSGRGGSLLPRTQARQGGRPHAICSDLPGEKDRPPIPRGASVMARDIKNSAASVHQRLLNKAKESSRPFNELLQHFAIERFIYRLSKSRHADRFILKGALMFSTWSGAPSRPTMDIDFLAKNRQQPRRQLSPP